MRATKTGLFLYFQYIKSGLFPCFTTLKSGLFPYPIKKGQSRNSTPLRVNH